jgi:hypothetical protein
MQNSVQVGVFVISRQQQGQKNFVREAVAQEFRPQTLFI